MKAYTCQIGREVDGEMAEPAYAEGLHAYSLIEAIDRAKAIVKTHAAREGDDTVRLVDPEAELNVVWARPLAEIRDA